MLERELHLSSRACDSMKVRASKNLHYTGKTLDEFKLTELSKNLDVFTPALSLSCNHCEKEETERQDSVLSFLIKFKADKISDPQKFIPNGVEGLMLPETEKYNYQKEKGEGSFFTSLVENHHNLNLTSEQVEGLAQELYSNEEKRKTFDSNIVGKYLVENYESTEWKALLSSPKKKNWKKYVKQRLKQEFRKVYCDFKRNELENISQVDPDGVRELIKKLNDFDCFEGIEKDQIRQAFGRSFI